MSKIPINDPERLISKPRKVLLKGFHAREIHSDPYIVKIKNLLSDEEIEELLKLAKGRFERSNLMVDGELVVNHTRTSSTAFIMDDGLPDNYGKILERMIERICYLVNCKREQLEVMCVRYKTGEKFDSHVDYFDDHEIDVLDQGGQRIATFFVYLNTLHGSGGETEFTKLGIKSKPRKGAAVFWWNRDPKTKKMLPSTEHRGNPVEKEGVVKYGLNIWIREKSFY